LFKTTTLSFLAPVAMSFTESKLFVKITCDL
jgi:hypothetical protein